MFYRFRVRRSDIIILLAVVLVAAGVSLLLWIAHYPSEAAGVSEPRMPARSNSAAASKGNPPPRESLPVSRAQIAKKEGESVHFLPEMYELARGLNSPGGTVEEDIAILEELLAFYRRSSDGLNPVGGLNPQIVLELRGENRKQLAVIPPDLQAISSSGELVDRWGTPYFFHSVSGELMEIRSAGPDRELWTKDDIQPLSVEWTGSVPR